MAFSPNGIHFATCGRYPERGISILDIETGETIRSFEAPISIVDYSYWRDPSVLYSPDGLYLAGSAWDDQTWVWRVDTGELIQTLPDGGRIAFSKSSEELLVTNGPALGRLFHTVSGLPLIEFKGIDYLFYDSPDLYPVAFLQGDAKLLISPNAPSVLEYDLPPRMEVGSLTTNLDSEFLSYGGGIVLTAPTSGLDQYDAIFGYQWYRDGNLLPGATEASLSIDSLSLLDEGAYTVDFVGEVSDEEGESSGVRLTSSQFILTLNPGNQVPATGVLGLLLVTCLIGLAGFRRLRYRCARR